MTKDDLIKLFEPFGIISDHMSTFGPILLGSIGLIVIFYGLYFEYKRRNRKFFTIEATIINSNLIMDTSGADGHAIYTPDINYSYDIEGKKYISSQVFYRLSSFGSSDEYFMKTIIKKYPAQKAVTAQINANNYNDSYLEDSPNSRFISLIIGFFMILISIIFWSIS